MAENFDLIFGSSASQSYSWNDSDYQKGWQTVGDTPPTREQFDALQRRADLKAQELNNRLAPIEKNDTHDYRQPSTTYTVGQIAYHATLPTGWYLECTTEGTTGSGELTISSPSVGGTVSDGTVVWTISASLSVRGGVMYDKIIRRNVDNDGIMLMGGTEWDKGAFIAVYGNDRDATNAGALVMAVYNKLTNLQNALKLSPDGSLIIEEGSRTNNISDSGVIAKSLGENGYIKYASGLILQWGKVSAADMISTGDGAYYKEFSLPVAFTTRGVIIPTFKAFNKVTATQAFMINTSVARIVSEQLGLDTSISWIAIGY